MISASILHSVVHLHADVSTYFRCVTMSHRWGTFELRDIEGRVVYDLDPTDVSL